VPAPVVDSGLHATGPAHNDGDAVGGHKSLAPAFVATGVAVAGGVVGLVFTLRASSKSRDADTFRDVLQKDGGCGSGGMASPSDCADLKDQRATVDSSRDLAVGAFVIGGVAAVAAGYFYWDALAHRKAEAALRRRTILGSLTPSFDLGRARANDAVSVGSVKLSLSGNF
jgi:hypothetical protein